MKRARPVHPAVHKALKAELRKVPKAADWNLERFMTSPTDATVHLVHWFCGRCGSSAPYLQHANLFGSHKVNVTYIVFAIDNSATQTCQIVPLTELKHGIVQPNGCIVRAEVHVVKERAARSEARTCARCSHPCLGYCIAYNWSSASISSFFLTRTATQ